MKSKDVFLISSIIFGMVIYLIMDSILSNNLTLCVIDLLILSFDLIVLKMAYSSIRCIPEVW